MPSPGNAPKPADQRRHRTPPHRGDWVDLPAKLDKPILPPLPRGDWPAATRRAWNAWRKDPVTGQYSASDIDYALDTIAIHAHMQTSPSAYASEVRLRMDALALTPKGKRDLRFRIPQYTALVSGDKPKPKSKPSSKRGHLTAV